MVNSLDKFKRKGTTHEDFYTTKELTELFGLNKYTIHKSVASGKLKAKQKGKHSNYKYYKNFIEKNYIPIAHRHNTTSVEEAYLKIAFCNNCQLKLTYNKSKKTFVFYGNDENGYRYCKDCTEIAQERQYIGVAHSE